MELYDVVVVGAGLAGLQCASLLGKQGARVLLVDRKSSLAGAVQTTGIFVRKTLQDFTLPEDCLGPPVRHVTLYSPARRSIELESPHDEFRVGRMSRLYLHYLDLCLHVGVGWRPGTRYLGCEPVKGGVVLQFQNKVGIRSVRTRYLVGADGASSRVARDLRLDTNGEWIVGVEDVLRDVRLDGPPRFHCFLDPALAPGYLAWLVHDGEEVHAGVGGYPARFNPLEALHAFKASLRGLVNLQGAEWMERRGGRIPVGGVRRRLANSRGLLVGDAAGAPSPLTAGGLDPCLRLSAFAAQVIGSYLNTGREEALSAYSGDRFRSRFISRLWMRRLLAALQRPSLLELALGMLSLSALRPIAWKIFFGRGSFPDIGPAQAVIQES